CCPSCCPTLSNTMRVTMSVTPDAPNGTMMRTGRVGQSAARAAPSGSSTSAASSAAEMFRTVVRIASPLEELAVLAAECTPRSPLINLRFGWTGRAKMSCHCHLAFARFEINENNPGEERPAMKSYVVGRLDEFDEGSRKVISCDGTEVGVFK